MANRILWNSPAIPREFLEDEALAWELRAKVDELAVNDSPSSGDLLVLAHRYNTSTESERDAIDSAFVWLTGYTFATICAMVVTPKGRDYEKTLEKWRRGRS